MPTIEKLTHKDKAKLKQLIHNVLNSTKLDHTITEIIIGQREKLKLKEAVIDRYEAEFKLKIRDVEMKNKLGAYLM